MFTKSQAETKFGYGLWRGENASSERAADVKKYEPGAARVQKKEEYTFTGRKGILDNGAEAARKHHAQRPKMTDDERKAALAAMMGNAAAHDSHRAERSVCCHCQHSVLRDHCQEPQECLSLHCACTSAIRFRLESSCLPCALILLKIPSLNVRDSPRVWMRIPCACRIKIAEEAVQAMRKQESEGASAKDADVEFQSKLNKDAFMGAANSMAERLSVRQHKKLSLRSF